MAEKLQAKGEGGREKLTLKTDFVGPIGVLGTGKGSVRHALRLMVMHDLRHVVVKRHA